MTSLVFPIKEIEARHGLTIDKDLEPALLRALLTEAIQENGADPDRSQAHLHARLLATGENVYCRGHLRGALVLQCQRCLEPAVAPIDAALNLTFVPQSSRLSALADPFAGTGAPASAGRGEGRPGKAHAAEAHGHAHGHKDKPRRGPADPRAHHKGQDDPKGTLIIDPDDPDDLDYAHHDREVVDLSGIVREYLLLSIPITTLCREDCKGLCPSCGADLNKTQCGCEREVHLSPFAALKNLDLNRGAPGAGEK